MVFIVRRINGGELHSGVYCEKNQWRRVTTGVSITLNAYSLSCVIKNCKRPKIYLATTLTTTCTNNAFNSIASILLFTELHVE